MWRGNEYTEGTEPSGPPQGGINEPTDRIRRMEGAGEPLSNRVETGDARPICRRSAALHQVLTGGRRHPAGLLQEPPHRRDPATPYPPRGAGRSHGLD